LVAVTTDTLLGNSRPVTDALDELALEVLLAAELETELRLELLPPPTITPLVLPDEPPPQAPSIIATISHIACCIARFILTPSSV
jgi:hypothetical protein